MIMYQGIVMDRLTGKLVYKSRPRMDYATAHRLAEKRAAGSRYTVIVNTLEVE